MAGAFYAVWWKFRGFIGGADAKALMCLSVSLPFWTPLVVGFSSMCAMGYVAITALVKGLTPKDVVRMKAPFLPFMYSGALLAILVLLWI
jgi:Flp pilus assembly protein protease CpaA